MKRGIEKIFSAFETKKWLFATLSKNHDNQKFYKSVEHKRQILNGPSYLLFHSLCDIVDLITSSYILMLVLKHCLRAQSFLFATSQRALSSCAIALAGKISTCIGMRCSFGHSFSLLSLRIVRQLQVCGSTQAGLWQQMFCHKTLICCTQSVILLLPCFFHSEIFAFVLFTTYNVLDSGRSKELKFNSFCVDI